MKQIPKLCIDCKHYRIEKALENRKDLGHCVRNAKVSLVTGEIESINESPFCSVERMNESKCGSEGIYFMHKDKITFEYVSVQGVGL
jgi:hypothetical protein